MASIMQVYFARLSIMIGLVSLAVFNVIILFLFKNLISIQSFELEGYQSVLRQYIFEDYSININLSLEHLYI